MAKHKFTRRQSGLIVSDDSIAVPKPDIPRPWYEGRLTTKRGANMGSRRCCCCTCSACPGIPKQLILVGSGIDCPTFNDTFVLSYFTCGQICAWGQNLCIFGIELETPFICNDVSYKYLCAAPGDYASRVFLLTEKPACVSCSNAYIPQEPAVQQIAMNWSDVISDCSNFSVTIDKFYACSSSSPPVCCTTGSFSLSTP